MSEDRELTTMIEEVVEKGATSAEEIHKAIAEMPLGVLERLGLFEAVAGDVREIQATSIGAVYDLIRDVNHSVAKLAGEILDRVDGPSSGGE